MRATGSRYGLGGSGTELQRVVGVHKSYGGPSLRRPLFTCLQMGVRNPLVGVWVSRYEGAGEVGLIRTAGP